MNERIEIRDPMVVPAQPGFRGAGFYLDEPATDSTTIDDIVVIFDPILAWMIRPVLRHIIPTSPLMDEPEVTPVYITGSVDERPFIVDPAGQWTDHNRTYNGEANAREVWLANERAKTGAKKS